MFSRAALVGLFGALMQPFGLSPPSSIEQQISSLLRAFDGTTASPRATSSLGSRSLCPRPLASGRRAGSNVDVMLEAYHQNTSGALRLDTAIPRFDEDKFRGAGVLNALHAGTRWKKR